MNSKQQHRYSLIRKNIRNTTDPIMRKRLKNQLMSLLNQQEYTKTYYGDELALRLSYLGFYGYMSCDECEVFITHKKMMSALIKPVKVTISAMGFGIEKKDPILIKKLFTWIQKICDKSYEIYQSHKSGLVVTQLKNRNNTKILFNNKGILDNLTLIQKKQIEEIVNNFKNKKLEHPFHAKTNRNNYVLKHMNALNLDLDINDKKLVIKHILKSKSLNEQNLDLINQHLQSLSSKDYYDYITNNYKMLELELINGCGL